MIRFPIAALIAMFVCSACTVTKTETTVNEEPEQPESAQTQVEPADDTNLEELQAAYNEAKTAYEADNAQSEHFITTAVEYGTAIMMAPQLAPRTKYPLSLAVFKEVLAIDPENKEATEASQTIVEIYGSMGREVPEGSVEDFPLDLSGSASSQG